MGKDRVPGGERGRAVPSRWPRLVGWWSSCVGQFSPSLGQESMSIRDGVFSWTLNAESIQLHHPPLHLTFQGTHISSLRCQTFSTCYLLWVPYVNSSSVSGGWAPRSGSTKVDVKMGAEGEAEASGLPSTFWCCWPHVLPRMTQWVKVKRLDVSDSLQWFIVNSVLQVITLVAIEKTPNMKEIQTYVL